MGYDNAEGKGDHRHYEEKEYPYRYKNLEKLWNDFKHDVRKYREKES